jgi:hypothetical protein
MGGDAQTVRPVNHQAGGTKYRRDTDVIQIGIFPVNKGLSPDSRRWTPRRPTTRMDAR